MRFRLMAIFCLLGLIFGIFLYVYTGHEDKVLGYYQEKQESFRSLASEIPINFSHTFFRDFFLTSTDRNMIENKIDLVFRTTGDKDTVKNILANVLNQTEGTPNYRSYLNIPSAMQLIKSLGLEILKSKDCNDLCGIDFYFSKKPNQSISLDELFSETVIHFSRSGRITRELQKSSKDFICNIIENKIPKTWDNYQFLGGRLSFNFSSENPNAVRFIARKYLRINNAGRLNISLLRPDFRTSFIQFEEEVSSGPHIITVDFLGELNLDDIEKIKGKKLIIEWGNVIGESESSIKHVPLTEKLVIGETKNTFKFNIFGKVKFSETTGDQKERDFKATLNRLVYDFEQSSFTEESSLELDPQFFTDKNQFTVDLLRQSIEKELYLSADLEIIKQLHLEEIYDRFDL